MHTRFLIYLNDHYALDGGAPPATAVLLDGVLVCFDSPKSESKVFGKVRLQVDCFEGQTLNIEKYKEQILMHSVCHGKRNLLLVFQMETETKKGTKDANVLWIQF